MDERRRAPGDAEAGHKLTRIGGSEKRNFERRTVRLPCRISFALTGLRELQVVFGMTRDVSQGGALITLQKPVPGLQYFNVEFRRGLRARAALVRRANECEIGCELLEPFSLDDFLDLISTADRSAE